MRHYYLRKYPLVKALFFILAVMVALKCFDEEPKVQNIILSIAVWCIISYAIFKLCAAEKRYYERKKIFTSDIYRIDALDGFAFERYLGVHFQKLGYKVLVTPEQGDFGVDLILIKGADRIAVQAKRYKRQVSYQAVQEVVAGKAVYNCNKAMVVTNSTFTKAGKELAKRNGVELWDRTTLVHKFQLINAPSTQEYHATYKCT